MPIISRKHNYLFVMTPRTGCTAIGTGALIPHLDGEYYPAEDVVDASGAVLFDYKHGTLNQMLALGLLTKAEADDLFIFAGVRNPFDSLVSLYEKTRKKYVKQLNNPNHFIHRNPRALEEIRVAVEDGFNAWVRARYRRRRFRKPTHMHAEHLVGADHLIRFESLQEDFDVVTDKLGLPRVEVPRINTTDRPPDYRPYYDARTRRLVERVFRLDLERFGYSF